MTIKFISFILAFCSILVNSQTPTLLGEATFTASGSGASGKPTVTYSIPAGENRILIITTFTERNHGLTQGNSNWLANPGSTLLSGLTGLSISIGGIPAINLEGRTNTYESPSGDSNVRLSTHYSVDYLSDANSLPTGNTTITFPNLNTPENAGDEMTVVIKVFGNAKPIPLQLGSNRVSSFNATSINHTASAATPAIGNTNSNMLYLANGYLSQQDGTVSFSSGWINIANVNNQNTAGTTIVGTGYSNEQDGTRLSSVYRSGLNSAPNLQITRSSSTTISRAGIHIYAIMPLARPAISGTVYRDHNGLTPNVDAGGGGGIWTTGNALYVNAVQNGLVIATSPVSNTGVFNFPAVGSLIEGKMVTFQLSTTQGIVNNAPPSKSLPLGWITVGESTTSGPSDGTANGEFSMIIGTVSSPNNTTNLFGITNCGAGINAPAINPTAKYSDVNFS